ncbi:MAG: hypothetical protein HKO84_09225, partial [Pseudomonadales bacterium]|nr:hypothetical protein [Pseudomonadales bacterium]
PDSIALLAGQKKPVWIYVQDIVGFPGETKLQTFKRLGPPHLRTQKYQSLDENMDALFASGLSEVEGYEKPEQESLRFYRLQGRYFEGYLAFHPNKGLVDTIITNPTNYDGIQEG